MNIIPERAIRSIPCKGFIRIVYNNIYVENKSIRIATNGVVAIGQSLMFVHAVHLDIGISSKIWRCDVERVHKIANEYIHSKEFMYDIPVDIICEPPSPKQKRGRKRKFVSMQLPILTKEPVMIIESFVQRESFAKIVKKRTKGSYKGIVFTQKDVADYRRGEGKFWDRIILPFIISGVYAYNINKKNAMAWYTDVYDDELTYAKLLPIDTTISDVINHLIELEDDAENLLRPTPSLKFVVRPRLVDFMQLQIGYDPL